MSSERPHVTLRHCVPQPEALELLSEAMARKYNAIPLKLDGNILRVAMADDRGTRALEYHTNKRIELELASAEEIQEAIDYHYHSYDEIQGHISNISPSVNAVQPQLEIDTAANSSVAQAVRLIIDEAVKARASDIHLHPEANRLRARYRVDGVLRDALSMPLEAGATLISRIKILASMNIADRHRPQDGQFSLSSHGRSLDIRVAVTPTIHGEMAVLRLLDKSKIFKDLSELGFLPESLKLYQNMLRVPHGMILVAGPTGAGKTTTLYASINSLDLIGRHIITIEDPVEYRLQGINQVQVNARSGLTFANGLRSILRLDPNVILVGEVRDAETAKIAIQAALTGHLVLSSIHASDAVSVVFRLVDLGIEPSMVASALIGVVAQRMVRRVCPDCGEPTDIPLEEDIPYAKETSGLEYLLVDGRRQFVHGRGCQSCANTGYRGRIGIFEVLRISDAIRALLLITPTPAELRAQALSEGMVPLVGDGMLKVKAGITTPLEVMRTAYTVG